MSRMPRQVDPAQAPRASRRLSLEAIVSAAIAVADREGLDALSMRRLAQELDVNPMSLYHHVRDKQALLDAMADAVVAGFAEPSEEVLASPSPRPWTEELRALIWLARGALIEHPWVIEVIQGRPPTPAVLAHLERLLSVMRGAGCSLELGHHALHLLGSRMLGFNQDPFASASAARARATGTVATPAPPADLALRHPHLTELALAAAHSGGLGGCDDDAEFDVALDVLLDGLERRRAREFEAGRPLNAQTSDPEGSDETRARRDSNPQPADP